MTRGLGASPGLARSRRDTESISAMDNASSASKRERTSKTADRLVLRVARIEDMPALKELIVASVWGLQNQEYSATQIEGALGTVYGTDQTMIGDGTFFIVEDGTAVAGCGGWSRRRTAFGSDNSPVKDDSPLDPEADPAKIRGFFVHPGWARQGIATRILIACEEAAGAAGFTRFEL